MVLNIATDVFALLQNHGYFIMFWLMFVEGPVVTYAAALAASLGYFNIWIVFGLSVLGNLIPDALLVLLGRFFKRSTVEKFVSFFGLDKKIIKWSEKHIKKHDILAMSLIKLVPPLPVPGLLLIGFLRVSFKRFLITSLIINALSSIVLTILGFYSGIAVSTLSTYYKITEYTLLISIIFIAASYFLTRLIYSKIGSYLERKNRVNLNTRGSTNRNQ